MLTESDKHLLDFWQDEASYSKKKNKNDFGVPFFEREWVIAKLIKEHAMDVILAAEYAKNNLNCSAEKLNKFINKRAKTKGLIYA